MCVGAGKRRDILGSYSDEYEDNSVLVCCAVTSGRNCPTF
jgi:hypothetical protein